VGCAGALSFGPGLAPPPPQSGEPAWPADRAAAGLSRLRSSIGDALAEPPAVLGPLSLEPRLALARHKLGDDVGLVVVAVSLTRKRSMLRSLDAAQDAAQTLALVSDCFPCC
jgi:hypothetical protein